MATTEELKLRVVHKHDTEENWLKATNFIPKQGEIIIYDIDANYNYERFKIGDGTSNVNALPFASSQEIKEVDDSAFYIKNIPTDLLPYVKINKIGGITRKKSKNLLPVEEGYTFTTVGDGTNHGYIQLFSIVYLLAGEVTISFNITKGSSGERNTPILRKYDDNNTIFYFDTKENAFTGAGYYERTITVTQSGYYNFYWWDNKNTAPQTISNLMLNEGATALPFEPYYEGLRSAKIEEVKSVGVNVFDISKAQKGSMNANGDFEISAFTGAFYEYPFEANTQYTISAYVMNDTANAQVRFRAIYTDGTIDKNVLLPSKVGEYEPKTWISAANKTILRLEGWYNTEGKMFIKNGELMINKGATALPYTPYKENTLPIAAEVQAIDGYGWGINETCYNYIDFENKVFVKRVGAVDMGALNWVYMTESSAHTPYFYTTFLGIKYSGDFYNIIPTILCTSYRETPRHLNIFTDKCITLDGVGGVVKQIQIKDSNFTDAATFKAAMSGVMLYYELDTPIVTDISDFITEDNFIEVEGGGTITAVNEYGLGAPITINYYKDTGKEAIGAKTIVGNLIGNASRDFRGQQIDTTYIKDISLSGQNLTFTKGNGITENILIQNKNIAIYGDAPNFPFIDEYIYSEITIPLTIRVKNNNLNYSGTGDVPYYEYYNRVLIVPEGDTFTEQVLYSEAFTVNSYPGGGENLTTYTISISLNYGKWIVNNDSNGVITFLIDEELTTVGTGRALRETSNKFSVTTEWNGEDYIPAIKVGNTVLTETKLNKIIAFIDSIAD